MRVLRQPQVLTKINAGKTTLWRWIKAGTFPRPIQLGPGSIGWVEHEVDEWLKARIAARDAKSQPPKAA